MDVVLVPAGGGEVLASSTGMRILEDGSHTGHRVGVMADRLPPDSGGPPQHIHRQHSEMFYVLSGTMRFTSAGEHADVPAGGVVTAPIGIPTPSRTRTPPSGQRSSARLLRTSTLATSANWPP